MMYYYWKKRGIRPSVFYSMTKGEETVVRAFYRKEMEEEIEKRKAIEKSSIPCPYMLFNL